MYDKAIRDLTYNAGSTPQNVGPGTYEVKQFQISGKTENYAPFMSLSSRQSHFTSDPLIAPPGPGHYNIHQPDAITTRGGAMQSKAERFHETFSQTPGPGTYNPPMARDMHGRRITAESAQLVSKRTSSRLKFNRVEAPSIPIPGKCYGYEECEDGTLKKQEAPDRDTTIGPAYYRPRSGLTYGTKSYKGCHFGNYSSKRITYKPNDVPGPGEYDIACEAQWNVENVNIGDVEKSKFESFVPRYLDAVVNNEKKWCVPGPAHYVIKRQFDDSMKSKSDQLEMEHPPFLSQAKRFNEVAVEYPAPGTYNDPRTSLQATKRTACAKQSPFGQTSVRFNGDFPRKAQPGPGSYNFQGMSSELIKKAYMESTRRGAFGSTAARKINFTNKDQTEIPGPSDYKPKEKPFQNIYKKLTSSFASTSRREKIPVSEEKPGPDTYEVIKSFERSQMNAERAKPRTQSAMRKQTAFLSAASRFAPMRDMINEQKDDSENPGPGSYEIKADDMQKSGPIIGKSRRFTATEGDMPGPGSYELSPLVTDTLMKGTFNVTLSKPMVKSSQG